MADSPGFLCSLVQKHLSYVLKWFKVSVQECPLCSRAFISAVKDPSSEEVIIIPASNSACWSFKELASLRECLPVKASTPLTLAVVDASGIVTLYSVFDGLSEDLHHRSWRPSRSFLENPEKCVETGLRKAERVRSRQRKERAQLAADPGAGLDTRPVPMQIDPDDVIVIDD